jgi:hypothetical protein
MEDSSSAPTYNVAIGRYAMSDTGNSSYNVAIGDNTMEDSSSAPTYNVAIGRYAMSDTGNSSYNVAIGDNTMHDSSGGATYNVALGNFALEDTGNAANNVAIGNYALENGADSNNNVAIGSYAGYPQTGNTHVGSNSVFVGYKAEPMAAQETNENVIGNESTGAGSNSTTLGNSSITKFVAYGTGDGCLSSATGVITGSGSPCFPTNPMIAFGDTITGGTSGVPTRLAGNTTTTKKFLSQTGTGSASDAPVWNTIVSSDLTTALTAPPAIGGATPNTGAFSSVTAPLYQGIATSFACTVNTALLPTATCSCATNHRCDSEHGWLTIPIGATVNAGTAGEVIFTVTLYGSAQTNYPNRNVLAWNNNAQSTVAYTVPTSTGFTRNLFGTTVPAANTTYTVSY